MQLSPQRDTAQNGIWSLADGYLGCKGSQPGRPAMGRTQGSAPGAAFVVHVLYGLGWFHQKVLPKLQCWGAPVFESWDVALRVRENQPLPLRSGVLEMGDPHGAQL